MSLIGKLQCIPEIDIRSFKIQNQSWLIDETIRHLNIRQKTGVTILAIRRSDELITTPHLETPLEQNDILLFTGDHDSIEKAIGFFEKNELK
jgi:monovalent cation:H+ antiporter-2, CPA2 family